MEKLYKAFMEAIAETVAMCPEKGYQWGTFKMLAIIAQILAYYVFQPTETRPVEESQPQETKG